MRLAAKDSSRSPTTVSTVRLITTAQSVDVLSELIDLGPLWSDQE